MIKILFSFVLLFFFNSSFCQSKRISQEDCSCAEVAQILHLKMDCDTMYRDYSAGCKGQFSKKDTINGEIYYKELIHISTNYTNELFASDEFIQDYELIKWKRSQDTITKEIFAWYKSPFTRSDTLIHVETRWTVYIEDPITGEKIVKVMLDPLERFCKTCDRGNSETNVVSDLRQNIGNNDTIQFNTNIGVLFSLAVMEHNDAIVHFYEFGLQVQEKNRAMWKTWEQYHQRLLHEYGIK